MNSVSYVNEIKINVIDETDINSPLVCILMITYNHEKYIAQAIEGIITQKANFKYKLIIGEDCSTDKTRVICKKYQNLYPDKICLKLPEKNLGMNTNFVSNVQLCDSKYIAICEGDDYWTDPYKLQKQVDFLETNEDYVLIHTGANQLVDTKEKKKQVDCSISLESVNSLIQDNYVITLTSMFRVPQDLIIPKWFNSLPFGDWSLWLLLLKDGGKVKYINDVTGVYRINEQGVWQNGWKDRVGSDRLLKEVFFLKKMLEEYRGKKNREFKEGISKRLRILAEFYVQSRSYRMVFCNTDFWIYSIKDKTIRRFLLKGIKKYFFR